MKQSEHHSTQNTVNHHELCTQLDNTQYSLFQKAYMLIWIKFNINHNLLSSCHSNSYTQAFA